MDPYPLIAERLRTVRREKGWSQSVLADQTGTTREYLCRLENGHNKPNLQVLERICDVLEISLAWLLEGVELPGSNDMKYWKSRDPQKLYIALSPENQRLALQFLQTLYQWQNLNG